MLGSATGYLCHSSIWAAQSVPGSEGFRVLWVQREKEGSREGQNPRKASTVQPGLGRTVLECTDKLPVSLPQVGRLEGPWQ